MIKTFTCSCGNTDPQKAKAYEGLLGYEAGDWSRQLVGLQNILPNIKVGMIVQLHRKPTSTNNATIVFRGIKSIDYDKKTIVCDDAVEYKFKDIIKPS